ncbi:hypothetical protein COLO4_05972 [Corchorus olitorius]|uniref:Uncharacterized protein n=1 Tax=Corchorus olitorius TaxID=93759 RepID=A0A1R3KPD2_9ROSI|nr:hypothetical protein COLO4_05972 [Corchorus olitorius]
MANPNCPMVLLPDSNEIEEKLQEKIDEQPEALPRQEEIEEPAVEQSAIKAHNEDRSSREEEVEEQFRNST